MKMTLAPLLFLLPWLLAPPDQIPESALPAFGRHTVLVYKSSNESEAPMVVRIAEFSPSRLVEWEDATTQGTILMPERAVNEARAYVNWQLYVAGVDTRSKNATTLWLSRRIFRELKAKPKVKMDMDSIATWVNSLGVDYMTVEVNREQRSLPVVKTRDERGGERWFLDSEDNPLIVNAIYRNYRQKLVSITTDKSNTLRWIKKKAGSSVPW